MSLCRCLFEDCTSKSDVELSDMSAQLSLYPYFTEFPPVPPRAISGDSSSSLSANPRVPPSPNPLECCEYLVVPDLIRGVETVLGRFC